MIEVKTLQQVQTNSPEETSNWGALIGKYAREGLVVCLWGDLGAGKTQLAKGVAQGLGITEQVTSPTFTLINEYQGRLPLYHMDLYRLGDAEEAYDLGLEEYFYNRGISLVEWPERIEELLPEERLDLRLVKLDDNGRRLEFFPRGSTLDGLVEELCAHVCTSP
jgi:tRNA threonylcarbamoyladenosine biosynthesis protein TsaE